MADLLARQVIIGDAEVQAGGGRVQAQTDGLERRGGSGEGGTRGGALPRGGLDRRIAAADASSSASASSPRAR